MFKEINNKYKSIQQQQKIQKIIKYKKTKIKIVNLQIKKDKINKTKKINGSWIIFQEVNNILDVNLIKLIIKTLKFKTKTVIFVNCILKIHQYLNPSNIET